MDLTVVGYTNRIVENVSKVIYGKEEAIKQVLVCFFGGGHVLLEDVPGTGKTMLLRAFSKSIGGDFKRIQFTPDLLPSDLTGIHFYNQKIGEFEFRKGPLFANIILADEINRATPRTQAALLETMEEKQISIDGTTYLMEQPYMVMATQNPIESYGTFPLPEAQMDRFFMRISMGYMERKQEISVLRRKDTAVLLDELEQVVTTEELKNCRAEIEQVKVSDEVVDYIMNIIDATRNDKHLACGVSTRGSLALYKAAKIIAAMEGRDYVMPEDVKREAMCVLPHRISGDNSRNAEKYIGDLIEKIEVPLERL
ncbi:MoxR-like ATPase [Lachnospiraceae bacterium XBB1006]|nr:MoxR-like ATPase [Lachnospiraceae bacterium XBB1006]